MPTKTSEVASVSVLESTDYLLGINYTGGSPVATIKITVADLFAAPPAIGGTTPAAVTGTTITATTGFVGDVTGDVTGDLTGDVTGNVTGDVVGNVTGDVTGNADTATALATARTINGVSFDGTANITVTAAAGTLTGTTLASNVVTSSLTAVGTIATGVWQGTAIDSAYIDPTLSVTTLTVSGATTLNGVTYTWPASLGNAGDRLQLGASGALTWVAPTAAASAEFVTLTVTSGADFSGATISDLGTVTTVVINGGTITGITDLAVADGGTGASTASAARTNLGLGSIATQDANAVAVTGGTIDGTVIGASTPAAITGTTGAFTSTLANSFFFATNASAGASDFRIYESSGSDLAIYMRDQGGTARVVLNTDGVSYLTGGNFLIGKTNDTGEKLQVSGTTLFTGAAKFGSTAIIGSTSVAPDGTCHIFSGSAGTVVASSIADDLVVENTAGVGVSLLTGDANWSYIAFGSPSDNIGALFQWNYSTTSLRLGTAVTSGGTFELRSGNDTTAITLDSSQNATFTGTVSAASLQSTPIGSVTPSSGAFTTLSATSTVSLAAATTAIASLNIPSGTAPTSPSNGDIWSDGSDILVRLGGTTYTLQKA